MSLFVAALLLQATVATSPQTSGGPATAASSSALAPTAPVRAAAPAGKKVAQLDANRMVCKDQTPIGSRIPGRKLCRTVAEWDAQRTDARFRTEQIQSMKDLGHDN